MEISQYGDQSRGKSVEQTITATHARIHFGQVLPKVAKGRHGIIVERAGRPKAVMLSVSEYERLRAGTSPIRSTPHGCCLFDIVTAEMFQATSVAPSRSE
jgi:prevent-host-death family protein